MRAAQGSACATNSHEYVGLGCRVAAVAGASSCATESPSPKAVGISGTPHPELTGTHTGSRWRRAGIHTRIPPQ